MGERWLRATAGSRAGQQFRLGRRTILGRGIDADIQLLEKNVSRQHVLLVEQDDGRLMLFDLSSTNGTRVGDQLVTQIALEPDVAFTLGQSTFVLDQVETGTPSGSEDIRVLSGPALEATAIVLASPAPPELESFARAEITATDHPVVPIATPPRCGDPLHAVAQVSGWSFCPACGERFRAAGP
ncbi:MAG: FHA domain-containing protein [Proteobacteria bacterium]|nr:FHA domain-containing protein [Pseudomonadota bacterium]